MSLHIRAAFPTDAGETGDILYRFQESTAWMPKLYTSAEIIAFCGAMIDRGWVTVAEDDGQVIGFLARDGEEICGLYTLRDGRRKGVGKLLLDHAKTQSKRLTLRAFQANIGAQRFYRREGFVVTGQSDGSANDEGLPDLAFVWPAPMVLAPEIRLDARSKPKAETDTRTREKKP
ncbi:GNAT family N-acetyltransferase [Aliisedimentitalea scapharcae]|uniref:GNAT family N-acetyltransferase n=1 Tax=Aliisedimentitalea scapharcae TaxID=1524259 RepID=A0ABZ2XVY4_9RHOB